MPPLSRSVALFLSSAAVLFLSSGCGTGRRLDVGKMKATPLAHELAAKPPDLYDAIMRSHPFVLQRDGRGFLRASTPLFASLDESPAWIGVTESFRSDTGLTGMGVVIGIVDTGIDWKHPDFLGEDGGTRILYILDDMLPALMPDPHPEVDHGIYRIYGKKEIDEALEAIRQGEEPACPVESMDLVGHGTHVASIAAGRDAAGPYTGIAPGAWLVVVKAIRREGVRFEDLDVIEAAAFIFSVCELYGLPCVVNLSLGGQMGGHDGSSEVERAIDEKLGEKPGGRVVVAAAGNHGGRPVHALADLRQGAEKRVELTVPDNSPTEEGGVSRIVLDAWARGPGGSDADVTVSVRAPSGAVLAAGPGELVVDVVDGSWIAISNSPSGPDPYNGERETAVTLTGNLGRGGKITPGLYGLAFRGEGAVDVYLAQVDLETGIWGTVLLGGAGVVGEGTIDMPATSRSVIGVGAVTVKTSWTGPGGVQVDPGGSGSIGSLSGFSGLGPARDGAVKPDFLAPGEWIAAALSSGVDDRLADSIFHGYEPGDVLAPDVAHVHSRGTSSAAPAVSGLAALLLEAAPALSSGEISAALIFSTFGDEGAGGAPAIAAEGYGLPDAAKAIRIVRGELGQAADSRASMIVTSSLIYAPGLSRDLEVYVLPMDGLGMPVRGSLDVEIMPTDCAMSGDMEALPGGIYRQTWSCDEGEAPPPGRTIYFIASIDGETVARAGSVKITGERIDAVSSYETYGGGCSASPPII